MANRDERKIALDTHYFKLLLQGLSCFIFIVSTILIALGVINATFINKQLPGYSPENPAYTLITTDTQNYCHRYTGVHLGIPGLIVGLVGLALLSLVVTKKLALPLAAVHLILCLLGFVIATIITDTEVQACLNAQSEYLKDFYHNEEIRHENYKKEYNWANLRVQYEFPNRQFPLATYVIIAANFGLLITVVAQIAAYLLSTLILVINLGNIVLTQKQAAREPVQQHEAEQLHQTGIRRQYLKE